MNMEKVDYINTKREDLPKWLLRLWHINPELAEKAEIDYISLKKQLSINGVSGSTLSEKCTADRCEEPAIADYNGHGDFGCKYHLKKWEKEFEEDYR